MPLAPSKGVRAEQLAKELPHMGVAELRRTCLANGISLEGCVEKSEVLQRIRLHFGITQDVERALAPDPEPVNPPEANDLRQEQPNTYHVSDSATKQSMPMTTARLKALERRVGAVGVKPMRSHSSGLPSVARESTMFQNAAASDFEAGNTSDKPKPPSSAGEQEETSCPPVVVLSHGGMGNDLSDRSSSSSSDEEGCSDPPAETAGLSGPHFSATGLVSDEDDISSADNDSDDSEESSTNAGDEMTNDSSPIKVLSTSESAFVQRMRTRSSIVELPSFIPPP